MSGKRLLDAARLFSAGRAVAAHHLALRRAQWSLYTRTSSLAQALRRQTDRVTVTLGAARELARRLDSSSDEQDFREAHRSAAANPYREEEVKASKNSTARNPDVVLKPSAAAGIEEGLEAEREIVEDVVAAVRETVVGDLEAGSQRGAGAEDIASSSSTSSSAVLRRRELQRFSENQIPEISASADASPSAVEAEGQQQQLGQDSFHERPGTVSVELSSLPRMKLPRHAKRAEGGVGEGGVINQDVFPAPIEHAGPKASSSAEKEEDMPGEVNTDVFASPRVSRMLGTSGADVANPYAGRQKVAAKPLPEMMEASERWKRADAESTGQRLSSEQDQRTTTTTTTTTTTEDAETRDLAASLAEDVPTQQTTAPTNVPEGKPYEMRESRVPSSRFGRLWQYGGLATSMAFGAVGEGFRRFTGGSSEGSIMLSEGNMNRLVAKLSRMRGAALKLGQMMSFQDSNFLPPTINAVLARVQDSADYMPASQRNQVLTRNLGSDWRELFSNFEEKPFAAASIGQVHKATLKSNGQDVAVKIQYPGVRNSIDSDLNNLSLLLTASQLLPRGLYLDKTIANARTELAWECDYEREAQSGTRFKNDLLADEQDIFTVPTVYPEASGPDVLTAEFLHGTAVTKIPDLTQAERDWIGTQILRLSWRELMEWRFMQTDPNFTNFLYNRTTHRLELLDFGASREFPQRFVEPYIELLIAASRGDRATCEARSRDLGYLTGDESPRMRDAHVDSILTLAEPFGAGAPDVYDFEHQTVTDRVRAKIGLMLRERLAPPPEETYSLHRKLSGAFLLCARLRSRVRTKEMFARAVEVWDARDGKIGMPGTGMGGKG